VLRALKVPPRSTFAVFGSGSVGIAAVMAARLAGARPAYGEFVLSVGRIESADFLKWDFTRPLTAPIVMTPDLQDKPMTEIYSLRVFPYEGIYIGLVQIFHAMPDDPILYVQLAMSRDSIHFTRVGDRSAFIPVGPIGSWDRFNLSNANNDPIVDGDNLRFYYSGRLYRHSPYEGPDKGVNQSSIGFATIKRDRFVSLDGSFNGAEVVSKPVQLKGPDLHLNAKSDFGEILVEVLDGDGKLLSRSRPIQRDALDIPIKWDGDPPRGAGPVTLRIKLNNARLFALWCGK